MRKDNDYYILYPGSWFYNASVTGFLMMLDKMDEFLNTTNNTSATSCSDKFIFSENLLKINKEVFNSLKDLVNKITYVPPNTEGSKEQNKKAEKEKNPYIFSLVGNNTYFPNYIDAGRKQVNDFQSLLQDLADGGKLKRTSCALCIEGLDVDTTQDNHFLNKISKLGYLQVRGLLGSSSELPNVFRDGQSLKICHFCGFLIVHFPLAFAKVGDEYGSESIFINGSSFNLLFTLNKLLQELAPQDEFTSDVNILSTTLVELYRRMYVSFSQWSLSSLEIIRNIKSFKKNQYDFYCLPYETSRYLSTPPVISTLGSLNESYLLEIIIENRMNELSKVVDELVDFFSKLNIEAQKASKSNYSLISNLDGLNSKNVLTYVEKISDLYLTLKSLNHGRNQKK